MSDQLPEKTKGRKAIKYRGVECLNCGKPLDLSDVYCSYCGQLNTTKNLKITDFFSEFLGSILTYDSRFRFTIKDLLFRPGVITRNYVNGQRLKYANPFRFFLSVSIIFFIVQGLVNTFVKNTVEDPSASELTLKRTGNNFELVPKESGVVSLDSILQKNGIPMDSLQLDPNLPIRLEQDSLAENFEILFEKKDSVPSYNYISEADLDTVSGLNRIGTRFTLYFQFYEATKITDPVIALDSLKHNNTRFNRWAYQKNKAFEQIKANPADFGTYLVEKTPFFVFFFTPFFAFFFWLIYPKKKHTYMEHMIFIFHIFSFVFLAMIIALVPDTIIGTLSLLWDLTLDGIFAGILFLIIGPFYFYKALRNFYQENRLITIIKFIFLNGVFVVSASISALIFFAITAALY